MAKTRKKKIAPGRVAERKITRAALDNPNATVETLPGPKRRQVLVVKDRPGGKSRIIGRLGPSAKKKKK